MWEEDSNTILNEYTSLLNESNIFLFDKIKDYLEQIRPIFPIISFVLERIETVMELTTNYKIWDAEIILRTVMETFTKLVYTTLAPTDMLS